MSNPQAQAWTIPRLVAEDGQITQHRTEDECETLLEAARKRASHLRREILIEAQQEAAFIREQAREEGYMEGYKAAEERAKEELESLLQEQRLQIEAQLETLLTQREQDWTELTDELSNHLFEIAQCCCLKLFDFVPGEESLPREQILKALQTLGPDNVIQLRVHPSQADNWPAHLALEVLADSALTERDFFISAQAGRVNGDWQERWSEMRTILEADCD